MEPIAISKECYRIAGKPVFLCSGEFPYFRVPRKDWRARMQLLNK